MAERIGGLLQESLLALLAYNDDHGRAVSRIVVPTEFEGDYRIVAERCFDYWSKHNEAPKVHLPDTLSDILEDPKNTRARTVKQIIHGLLEIAPSVNAKYILDRIYAYKREQQLRDAILKTAEKLSSKHELAIGEVEAFLHGVLRQAPVKFDAGRTLGDYQIVLDHLSTSFSEFSTGIDQLDNAQVVPYRGALMILIAVKGHGKSWWLIHLGKQAFRRRKKVVHISLEMSEEEVLMRYYQALFAIPDREAEREFTVPSFVTTKRGELTDIVREKIEADFSFESKMVKEELSSRLVDWAHCTQNFRVKRFPPQTLTPDGIRGYLDNLELTERFVPDLLIIDYAGLMKADPKNQRIDIGRNVMELRGIGVERNIAVATVHQSSREGAKSKSVRSVHASEDWTIVQTADTILTFSATEEEKSLGLGRLYVEHNRNRKDHWGVVLAQALNIGEFALPHQSVMMTNKYWDLIPKDATASAVDDEEDGDAGLFDGE